MRRRTTATILVVLIGLLLGACSVKYSMSGVSISRDRYKTFTVYYFPNRARLVNPTLSQSFTEGLKEKMLRQTWLNEQSDGGDLEFQGQITDYQVRPMAIQKDDQASQNRLTITVKVKYTNNVEPDLNFEKSFSGFEDFDSTSDLSSVEEGLVPEILSKIWEDIFNETVANW